MYPQTLAGTSGEASVQQGALGQAFYSRWGAAGGGWVPGDLVHPAGGHDDLGSPVGAEVSRELVGRPGK